MIRPGCQRIYSSNVRLQNVLEAVPMARTGDWLKGHDGDDSAG
jgi:hypothetical protein